MTVQPDDLLGRTIGPYQLQRLIGQGGFAWVFAGSRTADGHPVALKVLKPRYAGDVEFERRFRNESAVAAKLEHPNIVPILDVGQAGGYTYFAMELYPHSLASRLATGGPVPEVQLLQMARDLSAGLAYAHAAGIIHRDIKADNVLLAADGRAVITDFGIARAVSGYVSATGVNMTIGTPHYISPEQAQGRHLDGRSDLYALGVTLYKAATGDVPFRSSDWFELARMHVEDQPIPPRKLRPDLSARLERVILRCLAKHPDDRYPSAQALHEELMAVSDPARETASFGVAPAASAEMRAEHRTGRPDWVLVVVGVLVVLLVALAVVLLSG